MKTALQFLRKHIWPLFCVYLFSLSLAIFALATTPAYAQAGVAISIGGLLNFLIYAIIICVVLWLIWWLIGYIAPPEPFNKFLRIAVVVVGVLILIIMLLNLAGAVNFR